MRRREIPDKVQKWYNEQVLVIGDGFKKKRRGFLIGIPLITAIIILGMYGLVVMDEIGDGKTMRYALVGALPALRFGVIVSVIGMSVTILLKSWSRPATQALKKSLFKMSDHELHILEKTLNTPPRYEKEFPQLGDGPIRIKMWKNMIVSFNDYYQFIFIDPNVKMKKGTGGFETIYGFIKFTHTENRRFKAKLSYEDHIMRDEVYEDLKRWIEVDEKEG